MSMGRVKTKVDKSGEIIAYSEAAVRNNAAVVEYCRTSMAALSGGTAGLLGLTGFYGFGFYIFAILGLWGLLLMKAGPQWKKYFINRISLLTNGFFGGLFTYVLFWTTFSLLRVSVTAHYYQARYMDETVLVIDKGGITANESSAGFNPLQPIHSDSNKQGANGIVLCRFHIDNTLAQPLGLKI